ncbi:MAG: hypothetical protein M3143_06735, partial [Actinomycetota bacterium]|nr:hypothetical protein [Actinomycetota bacterium]
MDRREDNALPQLLGLSVIFPIGPRWPSRSRWTVQGWHSSGSNGQAAVARSRRFTGCRPGDGTK